MYSCAHTPLHRRYASPLRFHDPSAAVPAKYEPATEKDIIDREDLAAFREGQREALARVYRHFVGDVTLLLRHGFMYTTDTTPTRYPGARDVLELEALVQEVFARAFEPRARLAYDGLRPYGGFLVGIAKHVVLDQLRKAARRGEVLEAPDVIDAKIGAVDEEPSVDERRGRELVAEFLASHCDERDRALYALRYEHELSQQDAARSAGITRIRVRRWETKFRARLLRFLKRSDYMRER